MFRKFPSRVLKSALLSSSYRRRTLKPPIMVLIIHSKQSGSIIVVVPSPPFAIRLSNLCVRTPFALNSINYDAAAASFGPQTAQSTFIQIVLLSPWLFRDNTPTVPLARHSRRSSFYRIRTISGNAQLSLFCPSLVAHMWAAGFIYLSLAPKINRAQRLPVARTS